MGDRVKSVSLPGLAAALESVEATKEKHKRHVWSVIKTATYTRTNVVHRVTITTAKDPFNVGYGWEGEVASGTLNDDGLLSAYRPHDSIPYIVGSVLDKAWESLP